MEATPNNPAETRVVVLGAGFAGLEFCQRFRFPGARITLVDRQNHHLFQPLLYQVATAALSAPEIAQPVREILRHRRDVTVLLDEALAVDPAARTVRLRDRPEPLPYDYLVVALGARSNYFGRDAWERSAPGLKSLDDAQRIRRQLLLAFERAESLGPGAAAEVRRLLTMVVIGGGPTGVELAGAFSELARQNLRGDFRRIRPESARVVLVEAGPRLLPAYSPPVSESARQQLERLGVEVRLNAKVTDLRDGVVELAGGETIEAHTVVWMAGVRGSPVAATLGVPLDRAGRVPVALDFSLPGRPEVFVVGDLAALTDCRGKAVPGMCPAALQAGEHVARVLRAELAGRPRAEARRPFAYWDKGSMSTIGRASAVAEIGRVRLSGYPAWLAWLFIHLVFLVGLRNKVFVFFQWVWSYLTYRRGARIVTGQDASFAAK